MAEDTTETPKSPTTESANGGGDAPAAAPAPVENAGGDDASLLGGAGTETGAGDGGADGDQKVQDGEGDQVKDGPPETYELKVSVKDAEGKDTDVEIDPVLLEKATPILKDLGLSNDQANKVAALVPEVQSRILQQQADDFTALKADWAKQAKADPEIGGSKWAETEALAAKALDALGAPKGSEFRKLLDESGFGNHPAMIRIFRNAGEKIAGDPGVPTGAVPPPKPKDAAEELYPDDQPKQGAK